MKVRISGEVLEIPVCWSAEKVAAAAARYPDGIVDVDAFADRGPGSGSELERRMIRKMAEDALAASKS